MNEGREVRNLRSLPLQLIPRRSLSMLELTIMLWLITLWRYSSRAATLGSLGKSRPKLRRWVVRR